MSDCIVDWRKPIQMQRYISRIAKLTLAGDVFFSANNGEVLSTEWMRKKKMEVFNVWHLIIVGRQIYITQVTFNSFSFLPPASFLELFAALATCPSIL